MGLTESSQPQPSKRDQKRFLVRSTINHNDGRKTPSTNVVYADTRSDAKAKVRRQLSSPPWVRSVTVGEAEEC